MIPFCTSAQVKVQQTNSANITSVMPFYSTGIMQNTVIKTFAITLPNQQPSVAVPPTVIYDSAYDETDDTTYDYKPILEYGTILPSNINVTDGNWQVVSGGRLWTLKILINNAFNTSIHVDNFSLSPTASFYIVNGDMSQTKGPFTKEGMTGISTFGTFPMDGNSCYLFLYEPNNNNIATNNFRNCWRLSSNRRIYPTN